ncbi:MULTISPECIES: helix-turn-helix transcriptional regulator [Clostridium]|uniref:helix-turn-helix transcriptional regulator n=1 Tax=Clostridium TaxID=1485 RepID=UPI00069DAE06|nr:AraC family transcriptional regulator [Clostridium sp. DMHC 10]MCD2349042.1 AraC family transcriptional regulator [Clostridium guangxiense]
MDYSSEVQKAIDSIENNLYDDIKLYDIAKKSHLSEFYFHRLFHKVTGETVMGYVRKRRLSKAAYDLKNTELTVLDIAVRYQFSCGESFTRAFKKMYEITPYEYRKSNKVINLYKKINVFSKHNVSMSMAA